MGRFAFLVLFLAACPKKEAELEPLGNGKEPPVGRSVTKVDEGELEPDGDGGLKGKLAKLAAEGSGDKGSDDKGSSATPPKPTPQDAGVKKDLRADAALFGGDGSPARLDDDGRVRGPGGPIFMGKGPECNAERDHCMREGVWFAVGNLVAGKLYRAVPIFEFEKKWYNFRGKEESFAMRFKTKVGTRETLRVGDPVIWFIDENASKKFVDNEYDALTSSRWEAGVIEQIMPDKIRVKGWTYGLVPIDTTRVIVETKTQ